MKSLIISTIDTYSNAGALFCLPCPPGYTCTDPSLTPVACGAGTYWSNADGVRTYSVV